MTVPVDGFIIFFVFVLSYYLILFAVARKNPQHKVTSSRLWGFIIIIPAHNEEAVIRETILRALALKGPIQIVVVDDGSTDKTYEIASALSSGKIHVLRRKYPNAKLGKGAALNYAYAQIQSRYKIWFSGIKIENIIITVLDGDGYLDQKLLPFVAGMLERQSQLGGVQAPVTIQRPQSSLWLRLQDIEFVGFSCFVQQARHWFSSVGLGGNGQFIRASALESLGPTPWTDALSEDLDIGLRLLIKGQRLGFCNIGFVHQQGLVKLPALLKQRIRWTQGHYQAWRHIPALWRSSKLRPWTKADVTIYLLLVASVWVVVFNMLLSIGAILGIVAPYSIIFSYLSSRSIPFARSIQMLISVGPPLLFGFTYAKYSKSRVPLFNWPLLIALFCIYGWIWIYATFGAVTRLAIGKNNWVKTERQQAKG